MDILGLALDSVGIVAGTIAYATTPLTGGVGFFAGVAAYETTLVGLPVAINAGSDDCQTMTGRSPQERGLWLMFVSSALTAVGISLTLPTLLHSSKGPAPAVIAIGVVVGSGVVSVVLLLELRKLHKGKDQ
jgi:hypothetical protein